MRKKPPLHVQQLVAVIQERTGNVIPDNRYRFLEELAERRARAIGQPDATSYVRRLMTGDLEEEWTKLVPMITIKESYFFRAPQQFEALSRSILPRLLRAAPAQRRLRIWSAACARGEEPATLALVLADSGAFGGWEWSILATDVDSEALAAAERGLYGERSVAQVPPELRSRYFSRRGKLYELAPELRARIYYRKLNLAQPPYSLPEQTYDLIFLRNVLIYFPRPLQRRVVAHVSQHLSREGHLFLGASETLWQIQGQLATEDLDVCFCYRHPHPGEKIERPPRPSRPATPPAPKAPPVRPRPAAPRPRPAPEPAPEPAVAVLPEPEPVLEPFAVQEQLVAAAGKLGGNDVAAAAKILTEILEAEPSEPAAHALEGFLHDLEGRTDEAISSYRAALYLDPDLFQVRQLLGDCLLRAGFAARAEQQFREMLATLAGGRERELVLFDELPLPDRRRAERRARQVLRRR